MDSRSTEIDVILSRDVKDVGRLSLSELFGIGPSTLFGTEPGSDWILRRQRFGTAARLVLLFCPLCRYT